MIVEKKKRGRPAKIAEVHPSKSQHIGSKKHIIEEIIDYIEANAGKLERDNIATQASARKWSKRYYIYKNLVTFFNIDDKTFNGEALK